ncbi:WD40-like Beta Propeller Repeat [Saccharopolyspora kobensis]|uniref:WD40-like Beta Propeller Repeat n=1 Tax=Saccharopolyspora kobensis TaxID=146035 RepID=A0A1H5UYK2_9PSEU|nr:amidohydrolase family protein [Saccharopolyspora kobensis]SEF80054.1 WD40-like Beta Propeller Repeat [Saccharopolyspora kobensis]SFC67527.1 WD40-like Beta Propeller Repeat [Saccharopolyspora kobensis]
MTLSRRALLKGGVVVGGAVALTGCTAPPAPEHGAGIIIRQATNIALSHHAGTRVLAFDAGNVLWVLPLAGGQARRLTEDAEDATWPSFFPDGKRIAFQSFRDGVYDIASVDVASGAVERLTRGPQYDVDPCVSPDGSRVAYVSDAGGTSAVWLLDRADGRPRPLVGTDDELAYRAPTWHPDGQRIAYVAGDSAVEVLHLATGDRRVLHTAPAGQSFRGTSYGPSGDLAYVLVDGPRSTLFRGGTALSAAAEEVAPLPPAWLSADELAYGADGHIRRRRTGDRDFVAIPFSAALAAPGSPPEIRRPISLPEQAALRGIVGPALSPDGSTVCFRALNALWLLRLGGAAEKIVDDGYFNADPSWAPDGRSVVYSSDRSGVANLWRHTIGEGCEPLTDLPDGAFVPSVDPSGDRIAFQDEAGTTSVLDLTTSEIRELVPAADYPGKPSWSPDGRYLAMTVTRPASERDAAGHNDIMVVDVESGNSTVQSIAPHRSIATRNGDGPLWSPDGKSLIAVVDSLVHRVPVARDGTIAGPPSPLSELVADSVSVSASGDVLFLSFGKVVILGGEQHTPPITCRQRKPPPAATIRAGTLWDGHSDGYRENVDIRIENGFITAVDPARPDVTPTVDASTKCVIPGLIDVHNHWHFRGRQWGSRQGPLWLAYGVTTSRSPGDPAYQMLETRESIHSGAAVGPRFLGSGEPLDGTRNSFAFMRTVSSEAQLARELQRIVALDYNVVKSYQRLPVTLERSLVEQLRDRGIPVVSHYLYPAVATGLNGMEHTGGGNRLGYSRTLSAAGGRTAEDTIRLLSSSDMWVSSTLLFANEMFVDSPDLVEDRRTKVLFPWWEYERLKEKARQAAGPGNELNRAWTRGDVDLLLRVHRAGGLVVAGTDAPLDDIGISIHQNLRAMVKHGFSPVDALRTATSNAAVALGAEGELGCIRAGARADLLIIDGDPLREIRDTSRIERVFVDGHEHDVAGLLAPFENLPECRGARPQPYAPQACCRRGS